MAKLIFDLDQRVTRAIQNAVGAVVLGPPKLLGLPAGIWSSRVITEGAENDLDAMKTNFIANRVRRNCISVMFLLSFVLWGCAAVLVADRAKAFNGMGDFIIGISPDFLKKAAGMAGYVAPPLTGTQRADRVIAYAEKNCPQPNRSALEVDACIKGFAHDEMLRAQREWPGNPAFAPLLNDFVAQLKKNGG